MKNKQFVYLIVIVVICVIGFVGYKILNQDQKVSKEETNENISTSSEEENNQQKEDEINIDYDALESEIINKMNKDSNMKAYLSTCKNNGTPAEPDFQTNDMVLSTNAVHTVIEKLKTAISIEKVPTSLFCPEYTFLIINDLNSDNAEKLMSVNYANNKSMLLVGIKEDGYVFHFASENELDNFLEELK